MLALQQIKKHLIVVKEFYFENKSVKEIAEKYGTTPAKITTIKNGAIKYIKWWEKLLEKSN